MKIFSFVSEADIVRKILVHLEFWEERAPGERIPPEALTGKHYGPIDDGRPRYEEPFITVY